MSICPHPCQAVRQSLKAAVLGQDSACHRRFRSEASDWNLGFRGGVMLVLEWPGGGVGRMSYGKCRVNIMGQCRPEYEVDTIAGAGRRDAGSVR